METWYLFLILLSAFAGGVLFGLLGWVESVEPFVLRKFMATVLRSLLGAVGVAAFFDYASVGPPMSYLFAFIAGLGMDEGIKRLVGTAQVFWSRLKPL